MIHIKHTKHTVLITTSGIGERLGNITKYTNKSLVKVGDKYAICYIIETYKPDTEFIITLGYYGNYVKYFLLLAYPTRNFIFVEIDNYVGEGSSLGYSLLKSKEYLQKPFIFHCCDSIVIDEMQIDPDKNTLYVYPSETSDNYANIKVANTHTTTSTTTCNNIVKELNLKKHKDYDYVYTGISHIKDYDIFWKYLEDIYRTNPKNTSLSDVHSIQSMITQGIEFNYNVLNNWYDTGNVKSYDKIKNDIKPKYIVIEKFYESLCFLDNRVIKFINDTEINKKRVIRGNALYPLTPKILGYTDNFFIMDLIEGELVCDVYEDDIIYNLLSWSKENVWNEHIKNTEYIDCCKRFYIDKTLDRLSKLDFLKEEKNIINGLPCQPIVEYIKQIPVELFTTDVFTRFHGDFILDNIIKPKDTFRLIDWRHEFDNQLHYGDIYYDLAKLRHNLIFNHSNISNNLFTVQYDPVDNNSVIVDLKCNYFLIKQLEDFEKFVHENKYDLNKIKMLTSIIWLNMSPLYEGKLSEFLFYFGKYNLFSLKDVV